MSLQTISMVSKNFKISTRTLRYYEQIGLLQSVKMDGYAYRTYDSISLIRLQQIILMRKLRIPLKDIHFVLRSEQSAAAIEVFQNKINELSDEIKALSTIRSILDEFVARLKEDIKVKISTRLLTDESLLKILDSLILVKTNFKEETTVDELNKVNNSLSKLTDVRIVYLPPATVASIQFYCDEPEARATEVMDKYVRESSLCTLKPDLRHYGFNNPNCSPDTPEGMPDHGYEMWVTIPEDMDVPAPLTKKQFAGGLYAAHMIKMGDFHEWNWLFKWVKSNDEYETNCSSEGMGGLLEEQLNYITNVNSQGFNPGNIQLDLLFPIKPRIKKKI